MHPQGLKYPGDCVVVGCPLGPAYICVSWNSITFLQSWISKFFFCTKVTHILESSEKKSLALQSFLHEARPAWSFLLLASCERVFWQFFDKIWPRNDTEKLKTVPEWEKWKLSSKLMVLGPLHRGLKVAHSSKNEQFSKNDNLVGTCVWFFVVYYKNISSQGCANFLGQHVRGKIWDLFIVFINIY